MSNYDLNPRPATRRQATCSRVRWAAVCFFVVVLWTTGCRTTSPSGAKVSASVIIPHASLTDISVATMDVFAKAGFTAKSATEKTLLLERPGGTWDNILHNDWSTAGTVERVRIHILDYPPDAHLVECNAVVVSHPNEFVFEEEKQVLGTGEFKKLLHAVKARFP
jgi:hypothetical protein